jgi:hypothetical protein
MGLVGNACCALAENGKALQMPRAKNANLRKIL